MRKMIGQSGGRCAACQLCVMQGRNGVAVKQTGEYMLQAEGTVWRAEEL